MRSLLDQPPRQNAWLRRRVFPLMVPMVRYTGIEVSSDVARRVFAARSNRWCRLYLERINA